MTRPPAHVLAAFGVAEETVVALVGGQGDAVRAGPLVLKPVDDRHEDVAAVAHRAVDAGAPLVAPVRSATGPYVVDGWAATRHVAASGLEWQHPDCDWTAVLAAARALHAALALVPVPASFRVDDPGSRWARADAAVWSGDRLAVASAFRAPVDGLAERLRPVERASQIVHGDIAGNVLRRTDGSRLVIDFSPYVRPAAYAEAIVVVDALLWYDAPAALVGLLDPADREQLLLRATLFRLLCDGVFYRDQPAGVARAALDGYDRVIAAIG